MRLSKIGALLVFFMMSCSLVVNAQKDIESRVNDLLSKMTLDEKIGQLNQITGPADEEIKKGIQRAMIGSVLNVTDAKSVNELQRIATEETRLKIPLIIARDVIHGFKTIFPIPLGQAASWNPQVVEDGARVAAIESTAAGIRWTFAPMIDVTRDPRWGRIAESYGEDPFLTSVMGVAAIKGFQGDDLSKPSSLAACAKHFAGYGWSEGGRDYNTTWIPETQLRDVVLPPFEAAVKANAATFMCSFNDISGIPSSGNAYLNNTILRKEWGYDGVLVSDWGSIMQMINQGFSENLKDAASKAMLAGVNMDMMSGAYVTHLKELVESNIVPIEIVNQAVRNILRLKFRLGLFDNPYTKEQDNMPFYLPGSLEKAKNAAAESAILLKNSNQILPLSSSKLKSVAVIGPLSDSGMDQIGTWCFDGEPEHSVTPLNALRQDYGKQLNIIAEKGLAYSRDNSPEGIQRAVAAALKSDVVLLFVGEEAVISGEARCRADINLPGAQTELVSALKNTGKPVVMVVMAGRPLTIGKEISEADAVIYAFHGGTMAGPALADLIFGKIVPSGKLPVTMPRMVGQIPIYYSAPKIGRPARDITLIDDIPVGALQTSLGFTSYYLDAGDGSLYPFGYGLSYSTFSYSDVKLSSETISEGESLTVECTITNTGKYDASEVIQLYVGDRVGSLIRPEKEMKDFKKIFFKAGESKNVKFTLTADKLAFWNNKIQKKTEPGAFDVWVATDSRSGKSVVLTLR